MLTLTIQGSTYKEIQDKLLKIAIEINAQDERVEVSHEAVQEAFKALPSFESAPVVSIPNVVIPSIEMAPPPHEPLATMREHNPVPQFKIKSEPPAVDSRGLAWDERIHSSSKELTSKGEWRTRRNVEPFVKKQVEAELKQSAAPISAPAVVAPPVVAPPVVAPGVAAPVTPTVPLPQMSNTFAHSYSSFKANFPNVMAALINEKKITQEYVNQLKEYFGVQEIWNLLASERQLMELFENFVKHGFIVKVEQ